MDPEESLAIGRGDGCFYAFSKWFGFRLNLAFLLPQHRSEFFSHRVKKTKMKRVKLAAQTFRFVQLNIAQVA